MVYAGLIGTKARYSLIYFLYCLSRLFTGPWSLSLTRMHPGPGANSLQGTYIGTVPNFGVSVNLIYMSSNKCRHRNLWTDKLTPYMDIICFRLLSLSWTRYQFNRGHYTHAWTNKIKGIWYTHACEIEGKWKTWRKTTWA